MLRRLEFFEIQVPWSSPISHGFHHLHIEFHLPNAIIEEISPTSYRQFFCALRAMPDLQTLWVENCLSARPEQLEGECSAELPHLEKLSFSCADTRCADILKHIMIPRSCRVVIHCDRFSPDHFEDIADAIRTHTDANARHPPPLTVYLSATHNWNSLYAMHVWRNALLPGPVDICNDPDFALTLRLPDHKLVHDGFKTLIGSLWIDSIITLVIDDDSESRGSWGTREFTETFQHARPENVYVYGDTAVAFCDALRTPINDGEPGQSEPGSSERNDLSTTKPRLFLSGLKFLELRGVSFGWNYNREGSNSPFVDVLKDILSFRSEVLGILPTLVITGCSVDPDQVEELKEMTEVKWDLVEYT